MQTRFDSQNRLYNTIRLVRPIHLNMQRSFEKLLEGSGVTVVQRALLEVLVENGPMTVPDAARRLSLKRQFVQRTAAALLKAGFIEKQPNPEHRTAYFYAATENGRAKYGAIHRKELELLRDHLGDINITEVVVASRLLNRVASFFDALAHGTEPERD